SYKDGFPPEEPGFLPRGGPGAGQQPQGAAALGQADGEGIEDEQRGARRDEPQQKDPQPADDHLEPAVVVGADPGLLGKGEQPRVVPAAEAFGLQALAGG